MNFLNAEVEFEKLEAMDIIAASPEIPTEGPTEPTENTDPYEADKW